MNWHGHVIRSSARPVWRLAPDLSRTCPRVTQLKVNNKASDQLPGNHPRQRTNWSYILWKCLRPTLGLYMYYGCTGVQWLVSITISDGWSWFSNEISSNGLQPINQMIGAGLVFQALKFCVNLELCRAGRWLVISLYILLNQDPICLSHLTRKSNS